MDEVVTRRKNQPPPRHVVFDDLVHPGRDTIRPWLHLLDDESLPRVIESEPPSLVVWSSLWPARPDALIRFDLADDGAGTNLRWTLLLDPPRPDDDAVRGLRKRIDRLINGNLRFTYGQ
ncbi:hypothetical protein HQ325_02335 [Rhodococcus sp. BP-349]|uniref:SRPBCC family protein n=1 Tax=unclassified Rhodococcus (in: high G+C Gram-positive bacteria) TaxID=192944 RepID=UPI001C9A428E|nr:MULTISPECIES: hypothetical protein [unclassified Rhodococcus (in: high G+C Gram-positive bacteria)]MBY6537500.1 hypothetical protein [Rhodococcus sp. BP-363]MBY6541837.1 hypothetical protein [Rhodococcus sp. BP-369]MBY6561067.1 hypothetical protein [Rhodococcus sp. BP-370]MBY6575359.1 hypothetical protein [Rhodococcus sp. BP-364]MBY6584660.1 hypothetical protein [Rhodococcus sp. BP-358]